MPVQTTNSTALVNPFVNDGDSYILPDGVYVAVAGNSAVSSAFNGTMVIGGDIYAGFGNGISIGNSSGLSRVTIQASGSVTGSFSVAALSVDGSYAIQNAGSISGSGTSGMGLFVASGGTGSGTIVNAGQISSTGDAGSNDSAIINGSFTATDTCRLFNSGTITSGG